MAVMEPIETLTHAKLTAAECREIAREEKVFIYFHPRRLPVVRATPGDWIVAEPMKPVFPLQTITWEAVGQDVKELNLELPGVFEQQIRENNHTVSAKVGGDAKAGVYFYEAYVNGQLAIGGSSPGVIIDPGPHK